MAGILPADAGAQKWFRRRVESMGRGVRTGVRETGRYLLTLPRDIILASYDFQVQVYPHGLLGSDLPSGPGARFDCWSPLFREYLAEMEGDPSNPILAAWLVSGKHWLRASYYATAAIVAGPLGVGVSGATDALLVRGYDIQRAEDAFWGGLLLLAIAKGIYIAGGRYRWGPSFDRLGTPLWSVDYNSVVGRPLSIEPTLAIWRLIHLSQGADVGRALGLRLRARGAVNRLEYTLYSAACKGSPPHFRFIRGSSPTWHGSLTSPAPRGEGIETVGHTHPIPLFNRLQVPRSFCAPYSDLLENKPTVGGISIERVKNALPSFPDLRLVASSGIPHIVALPYGFTPSGELVRLGSDAAAQVLILNAALLSKDLVQGELMLLRNLRPIGRPLSLIIERGPGNRQIPRRGS